MTSQISSREGVREIAPDQAAFVAGEKVAEGAWSDVGRSDRALWGAVEGSGKTPYRVFVDIRDDFAYKCSCPSRKLPCKHALGLLLRNVDGKLETGAEPADLVQWLEGRDARAQKRRQKQAADEVEAGEAGERKRQAARKRKEKRNANAAEAVETLLDALDNVVRVGLNSAEFRKPGFWQDLAKRMTDFQTPGLANRLLEIAALDPKEEDWNEAVLRKIGILALLLEAAKRIDRASDALAAEIRAALGSTVFAADVQKNGERLEGEWLALGSATVVGRQVAAKRDWFYNVETGRYARLVQYSRDVDHFKDSYDPLHVYSGAMRFYDGVVKFRAVWENPPENKGRQKLPDGVGETFNSLVERTIAARSKAPWTINIPTVLKDVVVRPIVVKKGRSFATNWIVVDAEGRSVPARAPDNVKTEEQKNYYVQRFFEASFDAPIALFGEWDGQKLCVVSLMD